MEGFEGGLRTGVALQGVDAPDRFLDQVRLIESLGYTRLWLTDSSLHARYVYVYLTLAASHSSLALGTAVTNPLTRHPALNANAIATLGELAGRPIALGIGTGDRPLLELGLRPSSLRVLRETVEVLRRLLRGETVDAECTAFSMHDARIRYGLRQEAPIYIAASGPKTLQLAGEIADGVIVLGGLFREGVQMALQQIASGAARAGRTLDDLDITFFAYGSLADDVTLAIDETRSIAAWFAQTAPLYCTLAGMDEALVEEIRTRYSGGEFHEAQEAAGLVPDEMVQRLGLAGTMEDCRAKLAMLRGCGVQHVTLFPLGADRERVIRLVAQAAGTAGTMAPAAAVP